MSARGVLGTQFLCEIGAYYQRSIPVLEPRNIIIHDLARIVCDTALKSMANQELFAVKRSRKAETRFQRFEAFEDAAKESFCSCKHFPGASFDCFGTASPLTARAVRCASRLRGAARSGGGRGGGCAGLARTRWLLGMNASTRPSLPAERTIADADALRLARGTCRSKGFAAGSMITWLWCGGPGADARCSSGRVRKYALRSRRPRRRDRSAPATSDLPLELRSQQKVEGGVRVGGQVDRPLRPSWLVKKDKTHRWSQALRKDRCASRGGWPLGYRPSRGPWRSALEHRARARPQAISETAGSGRRRDRGAAEESANIRGATPPIDRGVVGMGKGGAHSCERPRRRQIVFGGRGGKVGGCRFRPFGPFGPFGPFWSFWSFWSFSVGLARRFAVSRSPRRLRLRLRLRLRACGGGSSKIK